MNPIDGSASDQELVRRATTEGRQDAFEILMGRYHQRIYGVVARLVADQDHVMDIVQETFMKAWRGLPGYEGSAGFYTWLYRIARNVVLSDLRHRRARPRIAVSLNVTGSAEEGEGLDVVDRSGEPSRRREVAEQHELLLDAIQSLMPDFREVIVLRDIEDHSYEDIAAMLGVPVGTIRSRLHRARLELKARFEEGRS